MIYVRSQQHKIKKKIPASAFVRMIFGTLFVGGSLAFVIVSLTEHNLAGMLFLAIPLFLGGATFIFFGVRALVHALKKFSQTPPTGDMLTMSGNPFFTTRCEVCNAVFDYQLSDLGFRPWFPTGYIECPCCEKPLRHNAIENAYIPMYSPQYAMSEPPSDQTPPYSV